MVPSRNLTVRAVPAAATAAAASRANAPDKVTNEPSATQRSLNSRRLSDRVSLLFTTLFLRLRARSENRSAEFHSAISALRIVAAGRLVKIWRNVGFGPASEGSGLLLRKGTRHGHHLILVVAAG